LTDKLVSQQCVLKRHPTRSERDGDTRVRTEYSYWSPERRSADESDDREKVEGERFLNFETPTRSPRGNRGSRRALLRELSECFPVGL